MLLLLALMLAAVPDMVGAQAVRMLHEREHWLADNRVDIAAQIEHGFSQAECGELVDGEEAFR